MVEKYPNLVWALNSNEELKLILFETCKDKPLYLSYFDDLIYPLIKSNCKGIQEKIKDANTNINKFFSITSELEIAKILVNNKKEVEMLADNYFKLRSPDILCKDESFNTYIEVMRLTESESTYMVIAFVRRFLSNLPYRVDAKLKYELSLPARDYSTRKKQVSLVRTSLDQFNESFKKRIFQNCLFKSRQIISTLKLTERILERGIPELLILKLLKSQKKP